MEKSKVYIKTDDAGRITRCEGQYTLPMNLEGWVFLEDGAPCDRLNLAQSHYFDGGLYTMDGIPRYKYADGKCSLRTNAEIEADRAAIPAPAPSASEKLRADVDFLSAMTGVQL